MAMSAMSGIEMVIWLHLFRPWLRRFGFLRVRHALRRIQRDRARHFRQLMSWQ
jgi:hypothetical protein